MDAAVLCPACKWFGVYRADVAGSIGGCPSCGNAKLELRDLDDARIHEFGNELLRDLDTSHGPQVAWRPS